MKKEEFNFMTEKEMKEIDEETLKDAKEFHETSKKIDNLF